MVEGKAKKSQSFSRELEEAGAGGWGTNTPMREKERNPLYQKSKEIIPKPNSFNYPAGLPWLIDAYKLKEKY